MWGNLSWWHVYCCRISKIVRKKIAGCGSTSSWKKHHVPWYNVRSLGRSCFITGRFDSYSNSIITHLVFLVCWPAILRSEWLYKYCYRFVIVMLNFVTLLKRRTFEGTLPSIYPQLLLASPVITVHLSVEPTPVTVYDGTVCYCVVCFIVIESLASI